jgi:3-hydroxyisobutyrate dehydrogenase-like beta-hydroxyacid dehydrogenase
MSPVIGFVGLGMMGHGMARNLLRKGYALRFTVHRNRTNLHDLLAAGAVEVRTSAELVTGAEAVILCVTGSPQVESIVIGSNGLLEAAPPGLLVIDTSTAEPASTTRIREAFAAKGCAYVDAPLARTPKEAEEGRLNTMVGATDADFARARSILAAFCENVIHVGPPGHGHVLKLINNMLAMTTAAAIAEADLRYFTHLTETLPTTSHLAEAAHQSFVQASNLGFGERFIASLFEAQEALNRVQIVPR